MSPDPDPPAAAPDVFPGDGRMAGLLRAHDWGRTPMGAPAGWPEALRTAMRIMLTSRFPMVLWWGADHLVFYNDAYLRLMGDKHPAYARPGREVWPEIWHIIGPMLDGVVATGEATWSDDLLLPMNRHGYLEETYWTYSYSPLFVETGGVAGVFTAVTDTTQRVVGERRLAALSDLGGQAGRAHDGVEAARLALESLTRDPADVPFAALYLPVGEGARLALAASTHPGRKLACPEEVELAPGSADPWRIAHALRVGEDVHLTDPPAPSAGLPRGDWAEPPTEAVVMPLRGGTDAAPVGVLVAGVAPGRRLDEAYRAFMGLLADQTASLVRAAREYEAERRRAEALAELDRAKTAFFNNVSHEFRTPLTLMLGPLEEMLAGEGDGDGERVEMVHRNGLRLLRLVNALLDFSRAEADRADAVFAPLDLAAVTAELAGVFRAATDRAGLYLRVECDPLPEPVLVDRDMWEKIVLNLLSNAVKFTWEGGVTVRLTAEDGRAVLRVSDTGTGVPAEELPRLFERFHRVRGQRGRTHEGSGIGLALVRELVRMHGGEVRAESTPGEGTEFTVTIPLGAAHLPPDRVVSRAPDGRELLGADPFVQEALRWLPGTAADAEGQVTASAGDTPAPTGGRRGCVLVADDNADMRDYVARLLADEYEVTLVGDGRAALRAATADPPDLVLSDVMMPRMDGLELVAALRARPDTAGVPIVLLSARAGEEASLGGLAAGADDYLVKPFSARELRARVRTHLELSRARRETEERFRALADSVPALIWVATPDGGCAFVNRGYMEFTGAPMEDHLGDGWLRWVHPDDADRVRRAFYEAVPAREPFEVELRVRRHDGTYRWMVDRGAPVEVDGTLSGYVGGAIDVDDRRRDVERQSMLAEIAHALDGETSVSERLARLTNLVVDRGLGDVCGVALVDGGGALVPGPTAARGAGIRVLADGVRGQAELERTVLREGRIGGVSGTGGPPWTTLATPLWARGRVLGVLTVSRVGRDAPYAERDLEVMQEVGLRAGLALDNARLFEEERASAGRLRLLQDATAALSSAATPLEVSEVAIRHFRRLLRADSASLWDVNPRGELLLVTTQGLRQRRGGGEDAALPTLAPAREAVRERRVVWLENREAWADRYGDDAESLAAYGLHSAGVLPLAVDGRCLAVVTLGFDGDRALSPADRETAGVLAEQCALALERARLLQATEDDRVVAERLRGVATALAGALDLDEVARVVVDEGRRALGADAAIVSVRDGDHLRALAVEGYSDAVRARLERMPLTSEYPLARAVQASEMVWLGSRAAWVRDGYPEPAPGLAGAVVAPLVIGGRTIGAVGFRFRQDDRTFTGRELDYMGTLAAQCSQALDRARLHQAEHEVAETLQRSLLPSTLPELERLALAVRYRPGTHGTEAGGDWYDVLDLGEGSVAMVVGDVVGKGPGAAAVMGQLRSALAAYLLDGREPGAALERLNRFAARIPGALATTVVCLVLDTVHGRLCHSSAGHPPAVVRTDDGVVLLQDHGGPPLAAVADARFATGETTLTPGDGVLIFTDGLFERRHEDLDEGLDRLTAAVGRTEPGDVEGLADSVIADMARARGFADDVALVAARLLPAPLDVRLPARPEELATMRRAARRWLSAAGARRAEADDLLIALGEAAANAVEHAYDGADPGEVELEMRHRRGAVEIRVRDAGRWRPSEVARHNGGRGLTLMRLIADEVEVEQGDAGTVVTMRRRLGAPPPEGGTAWGEPAGAGPGGGAGPMDGDALPREIDGDVVQALRVPLLARAAEGGDVVVDLRPVRYLGSAGVSLLVEVSQACEAAGGRLVVVATPGSLPRRVLALSNVDSVFAVRAEAPEGASR